MNMITPDIHMEIELNIEYIHRYIPVAYANVLPPKDGMELNVEAAFLCSDQ